jgi:hypothetical protein
MRSTAIKKQSYIRFATIFPGGGRPTTSDARHSLQFAVNIWQRFQMPAPREEGTAADTAPAPRRTTHRHARRQTLQHGYSADRRRAGPRPSRREACPPNRGRQDSNRAFYRFQRALTGRKLVANLIYDCFFIGVHSLVWIAIVTPSASAAGHQRDRATRRAIF